MTVTTFYASTPLSGIALGNSNASRIVPILSIKNPISNSTVISIQKLYWTHLSGTVGNSNLVWLDTTQNIDAPLGTNIIPASIDNVASTCKLGLNATISNFILIRPSSIVLYNGIHYQTEEINGEFLVKPGHIFSVGDVGSIGTSDKSVLTLVWEESPNGLPPIPGTFVQNQQLIGTKDSVNRTFTTAANFAMSGTYRASVYVNGVRQDIPQDYFPAESGGPGTGFNTIVFIDAPFNTDDLTIDYYVA